MNEDVICVLQALESLWIIETTENLAVLRNQYLRFKKDVFPAIQQFKLNGSLQILEKEGKQLYNDRYPGRPFSENTDKMLIDPEYYLIEAIFLARYKAAWQRKLDREIAVFKKIKHHPIEAREKIWHDFSDDNDKGQRAVEPSVQPYFSKFKDELFNYLTDNMNQIC